MSTGRKDIRARAAHREEELRRIRSTLSKTVSTAHVGIERTKGNARVCASTPLQRFAPARCGGRIVDLETRWRPAMREEGADIWQRYCRFDPAGALRHREPFIRRAFESGAMVS